MNKVLFLIFALILCATGANAQDDSSVWYEQYEEISYSELRALVDDDKIEEARVLHDGWWVTVRTNDGNYLDIRTTPQTPIADHLYAAGVPVSIEHGNDEEEDDTPLWLEVFYNLLPLLIFVVFMAFIFLALRSAGKKQSKLYEERVVKAQKLNEEFLASAEKSQNEFLERLEKLLANQKDSNA